MFLVMFRMGRSAPIGDYFFSHVGSSGKYGNNQRGVAKRSYGAINFLLGTLTIIDFNTIQMNPRNKYFQTYSHTHKYIYTYTFHIHTHSHYIYIYICTYFQDLFTRV